MTMFQMDGESAVTISGLKRSIGHGQMIGEPKTLFENLGKTLEK